MKIHRHPYDKKAVELHTCSYGDVVEFNKELYIFAARGWAYLLVNLETGDSSVCVSSLKVYPTDGCFQEMKKI
jgi:hypothetical protein